MLEHGVVLVGQGNKKGDVLIALMEHKLLPTPQQVMLIDDHSRHLNSVQQAVMNFDSGITYAPVLCTYLKGKSGLTLLSRSSSFWTSCTSGVMTEP